MERPEFPEGLDVVDDLVGDQGGFLIDFAAVEDTVADCADFRNAVDDLAFAGGQHFHQFGKSFGMGGEIALDFQLFAGVGLVGNQGCLQCRCAHSCPLR